LSHNTVEMDASVERQTEINEWQYNSKRDTLFFLQLLFIGLTIIILMYWMSSGGVLNDTFVLYVSIIIFALLGLIWYVRYSFTRLSRDGQHWNRIQFAEDGKKPSTLSPSVLNSVATATTEKCNKNKRGETPVKRASWEVDGNGPPANSTIDYNMFAGEKYGFYTEQTHPGSAAAYDSSGSLYGDRNRDGRLGNWDTTGKFDEYADDVSKVNLEQGRNYNTLRVGDNLYVADTGSSTPATMDSRIAYCLSNPGASDRTTNMPCKKFWCMQNPSLSWTDPGATGLSRTIPCRTLFPNL